jgi:hypothetical protein
VGIAERQLAIGCDGGLEVPDLKAVENQSLQGMTKMDLRLSRRDLLTRASAAGALGVLGSTSPVLAKAPMLDTQLSLLARAG